MNLMPFMILIVMFMLGINGKSRGVVNYKFALERIVFTLAIMPKPAELIKGFLADLVPETLAAIIGVVFGLIIVFMIATIVYGKIAKIPEYEYTSSDLVLGFITGAVRGFVIIMAVIMLYALSFADIVLPKAVTMNVKENIANSAMENSIEYYRYSIFKVYKKASSSGVSDLYQGKKALLQEDTSILAGYVSWTERNYTEAPPKPVQEEKSKETGKKK